MQWLVTLPIEIMAASMTLNYWSGARKLSPSNMHPLADFEYRKRQPVRLGYNLPLYHCLYQLFRRTRIRRS